MYKLLYFLLLTMFGTSLSAQSELLAQKSIFASPLDKTAIHENNCEVVFDGKDQVENIYVKELALEHLFTFTPSELKRQFAMKHLIKAEGQLKIVGERVIFKMNIRINADKARGSYGILQNEALLRLILTDGTIIYLSNLKKNKGKLYKKEGYTLYRGHFDISEKNFKLLKKHEVNQMGLVWSAGYELYDNYNMDFFKRQLNCLGK